MKGSFTTRKGALYCIVRRAFAACWLRCQQIRRADDDVHYYPDCYQPIADLRSAERASTPQWSWARRWVPCSRGHRREPDRKAEGALAGAAIGAEPGRGELSSPSTTTRTTASARQLCPRPNADVNSLNRVTAAGQVAYNCYSAKFRAALEDYKAKRITRAELDQRYAEIKSGLAEASAILGSTLSEADKREAEYRQVLTIEAKKASRPIPPVQTVATTSKKTNKATKTVTRKQTGDQLQNLSNGVGSYKESTAQLTAVKSDLDEIQLQMDKVMLAQG
ncbi:MAG: hypothetical protein ACLR7Z_20425 [Bilophila wadsworthia]